jgi:hypothetical protein
MNTPKTFDLRKLEAAIFSRKHYHPTVCDEYGEIYWSSTGSRGNILRYLNTDLESIQSVREIKKSNTSFFLQNVGPFIFVLSEGRMTCKSTYEIPKQVRKLKNQFAKSFAKWNEKQSLLMKLRKFVRNFRHF